MSDGATVLVTMTAFLLGALAILGVGIALARRGASERRRRAGWWIGIVAALLSIAFAIPILGGLAIDGFPT